MRMRLSSSPRALALLMLLPALGASTRTGARGEQVPAEPRTRVVRMLANRFDPAEPRARAGDTLRFVNTSGGPHNVEFLRDSIAAPAQDSLSKALPGAKLGPLSGPLLWDDDERYDVVIPAIAPGRYAFLCLPHQTFMRGALVVEP